MIAISRLKSLTNMNKSNALFSDNNKNNYYSNNIPKYFQSNVTIRPSKTSLKMFMFQKY